VPTRVSNLDFGFQVSNYQFINQYHSYVDYLFTWKEVYAVPTPAYLSFVQHLHRGTCGMGLGVGVENLGLMSIYVISGGEGEKG